MCNTRGLTDKPITEEVIEDEKGVVAAHQSTVVTDPDSEDAVQTLDPAEYPTANATASNPLNAQANGSPAAALDADVANVNEVQTISDIGTTTAGTFTLTFRGDETSDIAYDATAAVVQTALLALSSIGTDAEGNNNVTCAGGDLPTDVTVTFQYDLGGEDVEAITVDNTNATGDGYQVAETTKGVKSDEPA